MGGKKGFAQVGIPLLCLHEYFHIAPCYHKRAARHKPGNGTFGSWICLLAGFGALGALKLLAEA